MRTMEEFIIDAGLSMTCKRTDRNPHMGNEPMRHWKVRIIRKAQSTIVNGALVTESRKSMTITFSQGLGIAEDPQLDNVLDCLAADAAGIENGGTFEQWADEYGYDTDSRKAYATYKAVLNQSTRLHELLGDEHYQALLWNIERA